MRRVRAHLPLTNEKFLWARFRTSLSKCTRNPSTTRLPAQTCSDKERRKWGGRTSNHLLAVPRDALPERTPPLDDVPPLVARLLVGAATVRGQTVGEEVADAREGRGGRGGGDEADEA